VVELHRHKDGDVLAVFQRLVDKDDRLFRESIRPQSRQTGNERSVLGWSIPLPNCSKVIEPSLEYFGYDLFANHVLEDRKYLEDVYNSAPLFGM